MDFNQKIIMFAKDGIKKLLLNHKKQIKNKKIVPIGR